MLFIASRKANIRKADSMSDSEFDYQSDYELIHGDEKVAIANISMLCEVAGPLVVDETLKHSKLISIV